MGDFFGANKGTFNENDITTFDAGERNLQHVCFALKAAGGVVDLVVRLLELERLVSTGVGIVRSGAYSGPVVFPGG